MANAGDSYIVEIKKPHLEWGEYRHTGSRNIIYGEGYIKIPRDVARRLNILNQNGTNYEDIFGKNLFHCVSSDGTFHCTLRAQGCMSAGDPYAKQFAGDGNLKALGDWYYNVDAQVGNHVKVIWTSPTDLIIELL